MAMSVEFYLSSSAILSFQQSISVNDIVQLLDVFCLLGNFLSLQGST